METKPSPLSKEQGLKIGKAAAYVGISAALAYIISLIANDPNLFGPMTPIINVVLVTAKQFFTRAE